MSNFETTAIVDVHGEVRIVVPFALGTEVEVTISPKAHDHLKLQDDEALAAARDRMRELFGAVKGFRNSPRVPREELYERGRLH